MFKPNEGEIMFIRDGLKVNLRGDGRTNNEGLPIQVNKGVLLNCSGSALIEKEDIKIYCGIKLEIGAPLKSKPNQGIMNLKIESMKRRQQTRAQNEQMSSDKSKLEALEEWLSKYLLDSIDKSSLCLIEGKKVWVLNIEVFMLCFIETYLLGVISQCVSQAFTDLQIPKVKINHNFLTEEDEFELLEGQFEANKLQIPSFHIIGLIGQDFVFDMTPEEFYSVDKKFLVRLRQGNIEFVKTFELASQSYNPEEFMMLYEYVRQRGIQ